MTLLAMSTPFLVSYILLWGLTATFGLLLILMFRQVGLTYMPNAQRVRLQGLDIGARAPDFALTDHRGVSHDVRFGARSAPGPATFVLFTLPSCGICQDLTSTLTEQSSLAPDVRFVWVAGAPGAATSRRLATPSGWLAGGAAEDAVHAQWGVSAVPFGFVVNASGRVVDKRVVNRREDVDSALALLTSR